MSSAHAFDVTAATFQTDVMARSKETPVLLDFWADWCGPCRTLRPVLDALVAEYRGAFVLGAIDTEREQELSYAFQVQGIPYCVLVMDGRPVDGFQGALSAAEVRRFLERNGIQPHTGDDDATAAESDPEADKLLDARRRLGIGDWRGAREALGDFAEEHAQIGVARRLLDGIEIFDAEFGADESAAAAAAQRGREDFAAGRAAAAAEAWFESLEADRNWRDGIARRALVMVFEMFDVNDAGREYVREQRRRLATLLY